MSLTASDIYAYYQPAECARRVYLRYRGEPEAEPGPYEQILLRLGERHERAHLASLGEVEDMSSLDFDKAVRKTKDLIRKGAPVIYQPAFRVETILGSARASIGGVPDFIIRKGNSYLIRDCKISRRINEVDHPEIAHQLILYGWLYEQTTGGKIAGLEVVCGTGEIVAIPYDGGVGVLDTLFRINRIQQQSEEPYNPVGWSRCQPCGFFQRCWGKAEDSQDLTLVPEVDKGLVSILHRSGIRTIRQLAELDGAYLSEINRPWGGREQRVGRKAEIIIKQALALAKNRELIIGKLDLPPARNFAIFDIEGLPPQLDEMDKVYLWGLQVYGERPGDYLSAVSRFGQDGDRQGWFEFLRNCLKLFTAYGDLPLVHWSAYERGRVKAYIERHGDPEGIGERVIHNLLDLLKVAKKAIILPDYSYSLKRIERQAGYRRTLPEGSGEWAMAKYIEATEMENPHERQEIMNEILKYNREDLEATWAVLQWLRAKVP
ncbi:MAG: TM0106 family RecB-like putative nuclease [Syntrophobacterales bacterium]|nr:MAG: TM0106 family RecB-like putative nuclease [Syntrophobacterales bacterium]